MSRGTAFIQEGFNHSGVCMGGAHTVFDPDLCSSSSESNDCITLGYITETDQMPAFQNI